MYAIFIKHDPDIVDLLSMLMEQRLLWYNPSVIEIIALYCSHLLVTDAKSEKQNIADFLFRFFQSVFPVTK